MLSTNNGIKSKFLWHFLSLTFALNDIFLFNRFHSCLIKKSVAHATKIVLYLKKNIPKRFAKLDNIYIITQVTHVFAIFYFILALFFMLTQFCQRVWFEFVLVNLYRFIFCFLFILLVYSLQHCRLFGLNFLYCCVLLLLLILLAARIKNFSQQQQ